ncbi:MAG: GNAT family N-acetyltransferase [Desulfobacteraceae bacterium]|nr:MAG: GNAT family N-acetyltransferase [Desulfobacteraceae bacterium]
MGQYNLDKMLNPKSVAVVGATDRAGTVGCVIMENLQAGGFKGPIYPINPKRPEVLGLPAFPSIGAVGKPIDLAVLCVPIAAVPAVVQECGSAGVGSAVICSAGGTEIGAEGAAIEEQIRSAASKSRIRLLGPNCMGLSVGAINLNASFFHAMPQRGRVAFAAQSGAMCSTVLDYGLGEHIGFSHFVSVGNSTVDIDFADLIDYFGNDRDVTSILLYIEGIRHTRKFLSAARAVSRIKPIIVLKSGRSQAGAAAAQSHTGALAGEDSVYDAAFQRAGIIRANMLVDLFNCADLLDKQTLPQGPNMAIITVAGGLGVMMADYLADYGLEPARLKPQTIKELDRYCPPLWSHGNPIDVTAAMKFEDIPRLISICTDADEVDAVSVIFIPNGLFPPARFAELIVSDKAATEKPIFMVLPGGEQAEAGRKRLTESGFPVFSSPESAVRSFYYLYRHQRSLKMLGEVPRPTGDIRVDRQAARSLIETVMRSGRTLLTEVESKGLLSAYGIPVNETEVAESPMQAVEIARRIGYPVAAKIHSHTITHKSDVGGIRLDLRNADDVIDAFGQIQESVNTRAPGEQFEGVTIQKMVKEKGYEVILGSKLDPDFGPVLVFGMGGVMTEIVQDRAVGLPPLNRLLARRMLDSTKVFKLLKGYRGQPAADIDVLEEILIRLSRLVTDLPEIRELDINPLLATGTGAFALDARVVVGPSAKAAPWHMALSTYPEEYVEELESDTKERLLVRPIRPEDAPSLTDFLFELSERSRVGKLVRRFEDFDERFVARLTQIDYDRDMVLVALTNPGGRAKVIGLARYFGDPDLIQAEVSITIADAWQGQGVGAKLLDLILKAAAKRGFKKAWGLCRPESRDMISLIERQSKSEVTPVEHGQRIKLIIDLATYPER